MRQKKKSRYFGMVILAVLMLCVCVAFAFRFHEIRQRKSRLSGQKERYSMRELVIDDSKKSFVKIHTPDGQYVAKGSMEVEEDGASGTEIVLEMRGSIHLEEKAETKAENQPKTDKKVQPTILRVYTAEDEIYSFCSQQEIVSEIKNDQNQMKFHGYLEGYSDGERSYS